MKPGDTVRLRGYRAKPYTKLRHRVLCIGRLYGSQAAAVREISKEKRAPFWVHISQIETRDPEGTTMT